MGFLQSLLASLLLITLHKPASATLYKQHHEACNTSRMSVRREWGAMSKDERKSYTKAVTCLQALPSLLNNDIYPGAKSRYDDFLAVHINMTYKIHINGFFLSWHRGFVKLYEEALQTECGYQGAQPYWDWPLWAANLSSSPLFDGSPYSLGGDGARLANETDVVVGPSVTLPHGNGGGCIYSGPFTNYTVPFRSFDFSEALSGAPPVDAFNYTPKCLSRDLNSYISSRYNNASDVALLMASEDITEFQAVLSGTPATFDLGPHGGGHFSMGAQGSDFFASPGDPGFYFHHANIDRLWTAWQAEDPENRQYALSGTRTVLNSPPTANVTLNDTLSWNILGPDKIVEQALRVGVDWLCYRYE